MVDSDGLDVSLSPTLISYIIDTNVLIHDPNDLLNFEEHHVALPMRVLEELDKLKTGKHSIAAECRQAIRLIDKILGSASHQEIEAGVRISRGKSEAKGTLSILTLTPSTPITLPDSLNDNKIINQALELKRTSHRKVVLVTKDINMRLKARTCGLESEDYSSDQLVDDIDLLSKGFHQIEGSFWDGATKVETRRDRSTSKLYHNIEFSRLIPGLCVNEFVLDGHGVVFWVKEIDGNDLLVEEMAPQLCK